MRIAIIGTRGIPNNYGGFEQLAEYLSLGLRSKGHELFVYSSHYHEFKQKTWNGINIIHCFDPERSLGTAGQFIYDLNCIRDSRSRNYDVILNLGYTSSSIWMGLFPKTPLIITNMDGLEWKRTKYGPLVRKFLRYAEKLAVKGSGLLVADSRGIQSYLQKKYGVNSQFIAYGADLFEKPDASIPERYNLEPKKYNMLIARMEPENNIEMILDGAVAAGGGPKFLVVGNANNKFGRYLQTRYRNNEQIVFAGPIYDLNMVNNLRYFSNLYFHGHSVGGTNPSLLEAMGCKCLIAAHNNEFNRGVLGDDALYFENEKDVATLITKGVDKLSALAQMVNNNFEKIRLTYSWPKIVGQYEKIMTGN